MHSKESGQFSSFISLPIDDYNNNITTDNNDLDDCSVDIFPDRRCLISLVCNVLIACVLLRPRNSHFFFLGLLAVSDAFLSTCYGPVIAMDIIKNRVQLLWLTRLWWSYVGPLLALCHVSMTFSCFMIILGTIERFLITLKSPLLACFRTNRGPLALGMFLAALLLRGTAIFEVEIVANGNCTGLSEFEPSLTTLTKSWFYGTVFRFYVRTIATVFVPFFLLAYLNARIVLILRRQKRSAAMFRFGSAYDHKLRVRSATRLLLLIVCSYLLANFPNVAITAWEYLDLDSTQSENFYSIISMLYVLSCASRLLIYLSCNEEIRSAFYDFLCTNWLCRRRREGNEIEYEFDENNFNKEKIQRHGSTQYTPVRQCSYRSFRGDWSIGDFPPIGTDFDRVVVAMALSRVSSLTSNKQKNEGLKISNGEINEKEQKQLNNTNGLRRHNSSRRRISSRRGKRNENGFAISSNNNQNNEQTKIDINQEEKPA
uniref:G_PROTEIN_RECEP_F1_2 domain-containing protein n=1 Tax=Meloidogyne hapla TaxID=6305 RepID=A0A1I8B6M6_MELHA